ncbi:MAG TPA: CHC2 zinc finger domain-containing protein [Sphingomicrobium sp.]|nr:CHC2 zinc finger domain-containing protein [Sphingomicrobium sp.]
MIDLDLIRASHPLPAVVGASVKLRRAGGEWKGCCPFHPDRSPSFTIFDGGQRFHCFGCNESGDVLDYLQRAHAVTLREAAAMLDGGNLPRVAQPVPQCPGAATLSERDTTAEAVAIWRAAGPVSGTPAEAYLRGRGLHLPIPASIRFARLRYGARGDLHPVLVAVVASADDKVVGIQRTYLKADGSGKADVPTPKLSLGRIRGAAIRLAPGARELVVTGGLEDGLSFQQMSGKAVWAATGEGNMASMVLPPGVRSVLIGADNDVAGENHARRAADAFALEGRMARIVRPLFGFKDFNSELMGASA